MHFGPDKPGLFVFSSRNWLYPLKPTGNFIFPVFDVSFKVTNWLRLVNRRICVHPTPKKHLLWNTIEFWKNCLVLNQPQTNCNVVLNPHLVTTLCLLVLYPPQHFCTFSLSQCWVFMMMFPGNFPSFWGGTCELLVSLEAANGKFRPSQLRSGLPLQAWHGLKKVGFKATIQGLRLPVIGWFDDSGDRW